MTERSPRGGSQVASPCVSQYKDYVLVLLFIKYVSDKYAGIPYKQIEAEELPRRTQEFPRAQRLMFLTGWNCGSRATY